MKFLILIAIIVSAVYAENTLIAEKDSKKPTEVPVTNEPNTIAPPSVTTPEPIPVKPSAELSFNVTDKNSKTCALMKFTGTLEINEVNTTNTKIINLTSDTILDKDKSSCDVNNTVISILINGNKNESLAFTLKSLGSSYKLNLINLSYNDQEKKVITKSDMKIFEVDSDKSFLCKSNQVILFEDYEKLISKLVVKDLQVDAFITEDSKDFRQAIVCQADYTGNDFVPLAVGCALISLVFIVLIAYIIGRKRSHRMTYQSV